MFVLARAGVIRLALAAAATLPDVRTDDAGKAGDWIEPVSVMKDFVSSTALF